jgi:hypothetical protein
MPCKGSSHVGVAQLSRPWPLCGACAAGRSHSDAVVGCIVRSATVSSSAVSVSRSTWSRSRALNASTVLTASYLRR